MGGDVRQRSVADGWTEFQNLLLDKIEAIETSGDDTRDLLDQTRLKLEGDIAEIKTTQKQQSDNVEKLLQIVRDGNGKTPLVLRMELAERSIALLEKHEDQREQAQLEVAKARRNSFLSLVAAVLIFLLNLGWDVVRPVLLSKADKEAVTQPLNIDNGNQKAP
jgi:CHASE3 domain sensor protein